MMATAAALLCSPAWLWAQAAGVVAIEQGKVQPGDDPRWGAPGFDDSSWATGPLFRPSRPGPPGYTWHRFRIETPALAEPHLLIGPLFPAYEIFANGQKIGEFGGPLGGTFGQRFARPAIFALPPGASAYQIAIRSWNRNIPIGYQAASLGPRPSYVGTRAALEDKRAAWELDRLRRTLPMRLISWTLLLGAGDRFVLLSDGVVEAANAQGELFGFDRTREISGKSAQEIAEAARAWGQNDDITVVTVRRTA
jgi:hypothetical protein